MTQPKKIIVFTDLDGTLLDHENYDYAPAKPALDLLRFGAIPLILASSKTAAEMAPLRAELGFEQCEAIVENGAGLLEPYKTTAGENSTYPRLLTILKSMPENLHRHFSGFSNWSVEDVCAQTGLDPEAAKRAKQRDFSEPGLWQGSEEEKQMFCQALGAYGITAQQGGRFLTLSFGGNKALRMKQILARYEVFNETPMTSIALGDAPNDIAMLEAAHYGIIIPGSPKLSLLSLKGEAQGHITRADLPGPQGWCDSLIKMIYKIKQHKPS